jgi:hypothetical protein
MSQPEIELWCSISAGRGPGWAGLG